jgi:hypothetical protein
MKKMIFATLAAAVLVGCSKPKGELAGFAGLPHAHSYTPKEDYRKAYEYVTTHQCGESHHPATTGWDSGKQETTAQAAFNAYYCADVDSIIIVHETQ